MYVNYDEFEKVIAKLEDRFSVLERRHGNAIQLILTNLKQLEIPHELDRAIRNIDRLYGDKAAIRHIMGELGIPVESAQAIYARLD